MMPTLPRRPAQTTAAEQVDMKVKDGLSGAWAHVEHSAIAVFYAALFRDFRRAEMTMADQFGLFRGRFLQPYDVFLRDYQHVGGGFGVDVFEGEGMVVFVNFFGGDFCADDAAE